MWLQVYDVLTGIWSNVSNVRFGQARSGVFGTRKAIGESPTGRIAHPDDGAVNNHLESSVARAGGGVNQRLTVGKCRQLLDFLGDFLRCSPGPKHLEVKRIGDSNNVIDGSRRKADANMKIDLLLLGDFHGRSKV